MESGMELFAPDAGELVQDLAGRAFEVEAEGAEAGGRRTVSTYKFIIL